MHSPNTIGTETKNYTIKEDVINAHGFDWTVVKVTEFEYKGNRRVLVKVKKHRGRRTYEMVIYETGTISGAV